jgi:hypothetical protein
MVEKTTTWLRTICGYDPDALKRIGVTDVYVYEKFDKIKGDVVVVRAFKDALTVDQAKSLFGNVQLCHIAL